MKTFIKTLMIFQLRIVSNDMIKFTLTMMMMVNKNVTTSERLTREMYA